MGATPHLLKSSTHEHHDNNTQKTFKKFLKTIKALCCVLKEVCRRHVLGDFEINIFRICKRPMERFKLHSLKEMPHSPGGNELNGKKMNISTKKNKF